MGNIVLGILHFYVVLWVILHEIDIKMPAFWHFTCHSADKLMEFSGVFVRKLKLDFYHDIDVRENIGIYSLENKVFNKFSPNLFTNMRR